MYEPDFRPAGAVAPRHPQGFWRRQFGRQVTPKQRRFDVAFGLVLPVLCFVFDPVVFKGWLFGGPAFYRSFQLYAYTVSAMELVALAAWLFRFGAGSGPHAALGGMLLAGGVFSLALGVLMLPLSLFGLLFFFVGAFGFTPFFTAVVYLRNGWRAADPGRSGDGLRAGAAASLAFGFVVALGAPALAQLSVTRAVGAALSDVREGRELSPGRLVLLRATSAVSGALTYDAVVWDYKSEPDPARRERLATFYADMTGGRIEDRRSRLLDCRRGAGPAVF